MEEMSYVGANIMIIWLDGTGSDSRNARRRDGYHLRGMIPTNFRLTVHGKWLSSIIITGISLLRGSAVHLPPAIRETECRDILFTCTLHLHVNQLVYLLSIVSMKILRYRHLSDL